MENSQSVQQQPSEVETPTSKSENSKSQHTSGWNLLIHLLAHRPWLFLIGFTFFVAQKATTPVSVLGTNLTAELQENNDEQDKKIISPAIRETKTASNCFLSF